MAEYGINGNPKQIKTFIYDKIEEKDGNWKPIYDSVYTSFYQLTVDENGLITTYYSKFSIPNYTWIHSLVEYEFSGGKKSSAKIYDEKSVLTGTLEFIWTNDRNYKEKRYDKDGNLSRITKNRLNSEYREIGGSNELYTHHYDSVIMVHSGTFENMLDHKGKIIGITEIDNETKKTATITFKRSKFDAYDNPLETLIFDEDEKKPKRVIRRTIIYH